MRASDHTSSMLRWWGRAGVDRADIAVRRAHGVMAWHLGRSVRHLPLPWARAQNVRHAEIYVRPARGASWPLVFLDDVPIAPALTIARKYAALVIRTSPAGGCHVWLRCTTSLGEDARCHAQRWLASRIGADKGSVSGEHLGRLAGFRNWKRGGVWVNVVLASEQPPPWDPAVALATYPLDAEYPGADSARPNNSIDTSPSGKEWGWVCGMLEAGLDPTIVHARLLEHALPRRGPDASRYATRTIDRALCQRYALSPPTRDPRES
jgi:hypothetical protein